MKGPMLYAKITRSFKSEEELAKYLEENPTYELKTLFGNHGINAVIHDIRQAEYNYYGLNGDRQVVKWLE